MSLVLEFAPQGDVLAYMKREKLSLSSGNRAFFVGITLWQIFQAVSYLATVRVAHRDIKPENILVFGGRWYLTTAKLCDFGNAVYVKPGQRQSTLCGTPEYIPPEMLQRPSLCGLAAPIGVATRPTYAAELVDRWMLGILALDLMYGLTPFRPTESETALLADDEINEAIFNKIRCFSGSIEHTFEKPFFRDLVARFLRIEPTERLSPTNAVQHPFCVALRNANIRKIE